jgi:hypothetical protein
MKIWFFGNFFFHKKNQGTCDRIFILQNGEKFTPNKKRFFFVGIP